jgi:hypothetical protein
MKKKTIQILGLLFSIIVVFVLIKSSPFYLNEKNETEGEIIEVQQDWALNNWGSSILVWKYKYEFRVNNKTFNDYLIESAQNRKIEKGSKLLIEFSKKNPKNNKVIRKIELIYETPLKD